MTSPVVARAAACAVAAVVAVTTATPAQAIQAIQAIQVPTTRTYSATIDGAAGWERESSCSPTEKKGPRKLRTLLTRTYGVIPSNIVRPCSGADSGHEEGRALDWMVNVRVPDQRAIADSFLTWAQASDDFGNTAAMARRLGISYLIWNNQMWRPRDGQWSDYNGCTKRKMRFKRFDTTCHRDHVHVSFSWDGALGRTSFWSGWVACPAPPVEPELPAVLTPVSGVLPVTPTRLLDSKTGQGLPAGGCRVHPEVRVDLPVLGQGGVPAYDVAAVTLQVRATHLDAPTELRAWTGGTTEPFEAVALGGKGAPAVATVTVPVPTTGVVSLELAGGMGHLAVDVTGYVVGAAT